MPWFWRVQLLLVRLPQSSIWQMWLKTKWLGSTITCTRIFRSILAPMFLHRPNRMASSSFKKEFWSRRSGTAIGSFSMSWILRHLRCWRLWIGCSTIIGNCISLRHKRRSRHIQTSESLPLKIRLKAMVAGKSSPKLSRIDLSWSRLAMFQPMSCKRSWSRSVGFQRAGPSWWSGLWKTYRSIDHRAVYSQARIRRSPWETSSNGQIEWTLTRAW